MLLSHLGTGLGEDRRAAHRVLEQAHSDLAVLRIREEALLLRAIRKSGSRRRYLISCGASLYNVCHTSKS